MGEEHIKPYVPEQADLPEFTVRAMVLGLIQACILGAANAYIGLKAGLTVSATFPAAVVSMAVLRLFRGSVLEENIARTTASVGESLIAGAVFTIPAFVMAGVWSEMKYWESSLIMLVGGVLGILFVIVLRRILLEDTTLPFPESVACGEIVKAGQRGQTGAKYVFWALGLGALIEFFKNSRGLQILGESFSLFWKFGESRIQLYSGGQALGAPTVHQGAVLLSTPAASPALVGVGYIIGPKLAAISFSGGVLGWLVMIPLAIFLNTELSNLVTGPQPVDWETLAGAVWYYQVRPIAVGAMLVGAVHTLYKLRQPLLDGIARAFREVKAGRELRAQVPRLQKDLPYGWIFAGIVVFTVPMFFLYNYFAGQVGGAIMATVVMVITGFLFSAVAAYLAGVIGGSNSPISGLTLSTLIVAALVMVLIGVKGDQGVAAVLGVAAVICCATGLGGEMMQDLKVGQILGGTPWKMEAAEIIGVVVTAFVLVIPMNILHAGTPGGIGGENLPAPQAGLMSLMSRGIVSGQMPWPLVFVGMGLALGLILIKSPSPTLIAVGMYLPFPSVAAIFVGGVIKFIADKIADRKKLETTGRDRYENIGVLLASGLVAGEALIGVLLASLYLANIELPTISENAYLGLIIFPILFVVLALVPLRSTKA
jgi:putative OPT family oligopeptide transporter